MTGRWKAWYPAAALAVGLALNTTVVAHQSGPVALRAPITTVAPTALGAAGEDVPVSDDERRVAGMTSYMLRQYHPGGYPPFSIYVGYYNEQRQGKTIHSPKNCLPGAGWEPVDSRPDTVMTATGPAIINRYRLVQGNSVALVYYWYQGRGRVAHNEFAVKFDLLRDAVLHGRTEEALARIFVPLAAGQDPDAADRLARAEAPALIAELNRVLPPL